MKKDTDVAPLVEAPGFSLEPDVGFSPLNSWETADGKSRPTGPQEQLDGVLLWALPVRVLIYSFSEAKRVDSRIIVPAKSKPDIDAIIAAIDDSDDLEIN